MRALARCGGADTTCANACCEPLAKTNLQSTAEHLPPIIGYLFFPADATSPLCALQMQRADVASSACLFWALYHGKGGLIQHMNDHQ